MTKSGLHANPTKNNFARNHFVVRRRNCVESKKCSPHPLSTLQVHRRLPQELRVLRLKRDCTPALFFNSALTLCTRRRKDCYTPFFFTMARNSPKVSSNITQRSDTPCREKPRSGSFAWEKLLVVVVRGFLVWCCVVVCLVSSLGVNHGCVAILVEDSVHEGLSWCVKTKIMEWWVGGEPRRSAGPTLRGAGGSRTLEEGGGLAVNPRRPTHPTRRQILVVLRVRDASTIPCRGAFGVRAERRVGTFRRYQPGWCLTGAKASTVWRFFFFLH